jgi:hypothetical protein
MEPTQPPIIVEPAKIPPREPVGGPPIHPLSAIVLIVVDGLWALEDWAILLWAITIPLSFLLVFIPTWLIQRYVKGDTRGKASAYAAFLAVLAAVPTPITGTLMGTLALAWAGLGKFRWFLSHR